jgi:hypothetical protein
VNAAPTDGLPAITAGTISWRCQRPLADGPAQDPVAVEEAPMRRGTGTIRLGFPLDDDLPAAATCRIRNPDPDDPDGPTTPVIDAIRMESTYRGERLLLTTEFGPVVLERFGPAGQLLGEYTSIDSGGFGPVEADGGPYSGALGRLGFEPTDPRYVPLGGPGGPERFELSLTVDCRIP